MTVTAPSAAPADTPMSAGSASGLRNRACNSTPAVASKAPASRPCSTRGARTFHTTVRMASVRLSSCQPNSTASTWAGGIRTAPVPMATMAVATHSSMAPASSKGPLRRPFTRPFERPFTGTVRSRKHLRMQLPPQHADAFGREDAHALQILPRHRDQPPGLACGSG